MACLVLAFLTAAAVPVSAAETWADWQTGFSNAPLTATFEPGWNVASQAPRRTGQPEPNRGYEGDLVIESAGGAESITGPLTLRMLFAPLVPDDMIWPGGDPPSDVNPSAVPRRPHAEETWTLPCVFPIRVPVVLPVSMHLPFNRMDHRGKHGAAGGRYEILDGDGNLIGRGVLPLRELAEQARTLVGADSGDDAMKELTSRAGNADRVDDLPDAYAAYRMISGIWFTEALWNRLAGREALLRRLLLAGVRFSGSPDLVERMRSSLGTGYRGQAVTESIGTDGLRSHYERAGLRKLYLAEDERDSGASRPRNRSSSSWRHRNLETFFENSTDLFRRDRARYMAWTLAGLFVFVAGAVVILAVVFGRMKGERRVAVWWTLPLWTAVCFAAIRGGGALLLDRRDRVDVTEYRLIMDGWPEMHCRAVASAMTFASGRPEWTLPPDAVVLVENMYGSSAALDGWWRRLDIRHTPAEMRLRLPRQSTGATLRLEAGWFEPAVAPLSLVPAPDGTGRVARAAEDLDAVYVLAEGVWRELGPMVAGTSLDPLKAAHIRHDSHLPGLPALLDETYRHWVPATPCRNPEHNHPPQALNAPKHDWIVVAWRRDAPPRVSPVWRNPLKKGRLIWVMQFP